MKISVKNIVVIITIILSTTITCSCATQGVNLGDAGKVKIERIPSKFAYFSNLNIYLTETGVTISGELKKRIPTKGYPIPGYVEIEILSPDNLLVTTVNTNYKRKRRKSLTSIFIVYIPELIPDGSTIRVIHHCEKLV
jgi:hypothetical protein